MRSTYIEVVREFSFFLSSFLSIFLSRSTHRKLSFCVAMISRTESQKIFVETGEWHFVPPFTNIWQDDRVFGMKISFWWFFAGVRTRNFFRDLWRGVRKWILFLKIIPDVRNYCCTEDRNRKSTISPPDRFKVQNRMSSAVSDIVLKIVTTHIKCHL